MSTDAAPTSSMSGDHRLQAAFDGAWRVAPTWEATYLLAGNATRLRIAGTMLAPAVSTPFAHLRLADDPVVADLRIDLWDAHETGVAGPPAPPADVAGTSWLVDDDILAASVDGSRVRHVSPTGTFMLDRRARRLIGWFADARALPLYERARPLRILLALCASDRAVHAVHGACVARGADGILLAGDSGTGKSTAALCCLEEGWTFLADDRVGIGRAPDGNIIAHSLYGSVMLDAAQVARFPRLRNLAVSPQHHADLKSLFLLSQIYPERLGRTAEVRALVLPRLASRADSRVQPAAKKDALLTMARGVICTMRPRGGREAMAALTRLAQERPAFWLDLGDDLTQIPTRISEVLARVS